jgi:hypothetical protein
VQKSSNVWEVNFPALSTVNVELEVLENVLSILVYVLTVEEKLGFW